MLLKKLLEVVEEFLMKVEPEMNDDSDEMEVEREIEYRHLKQLQRGNHTKFENQQPKEITCEILE